MEASGIQSPTTPYIDNYNKAFFEGVQKELDQAAKPADKEAIFQRLDTVARDVFLVLERMHIFAEHIGTEKADGRFDFDSAYARFLLLAEKLTSQEKEKEQLHKISAILHSISQFSGRPKLESIFSSSPQITPSLTVDEDELGVSTILTSRSSQRVRKIEDTNHSSLTPEEVPRSLNIYSINTISKHLEEFRRQELEYMILLACIDGEMRETITLEWSSSKCILEVIEELLQQPEEERDFAAAQKSLLSKLDMTKLEEMACYNSLAGARTHVIRKGVEVKITKELKAELLATFSAFVDRKFAEVYRETTFSVDVDLNNMKAQVEESLEDKLLLKDEMLESKVAIHMEAEDLKTTPEFKALFRARKKLTSDFASSNMWEAADNGDLERLREELNSNCSIVDKLSAVANRYVNKKNELGYTALHIASYKGHEALVDLLLEYGASRQIGDNNGYQTLHWAARGGHASICRKLLARDPSIINAEAYVIDSNGRVDGAYRRTALHRAAYHNHTETVKVLLELGANPNAQTSKQNDCVTPLQDAISNGSDRAIAELLKVDRTNYKKKNNQAIEQANRIMIDVEIRDDRDRTALHWALLGGRTDYAAMIIGHPSYNRKKDAADPNSIENLLFIKPFKNADAVKNFLEQLRR